MIKIDKEYLSSYKERNSSKARSEVLSALFIENFFYKDETLLVGTNPNLLLPDIHNFDNSLGFEVVRCVCEKESKIERDAKLVDKYYNEKEHREETVKNIKKNKQSKIIFYDIMQKKVIMCYKPPEQTNEELLSIFENELKKKLNKLNNGNYSNCKNISLIVLNAVDKTTDFNFNLLLNTYKKESKEFRQNFIGLYFITKNQIYYVNKNMNIDKTLVLNDEFDKLSNKMKKMLKIDEYKDDLQ